MSSEFDALWRENNVAESGDGVKHLNHPELAKIGFELSSFYVEGRTDLSMIIYNPAIAEDAQRVRAFLAKC